jgi:hypothetical protein
MPECSPGEAQRNPGKEPLNDLFAGFSWNRVPCIGQSGDLLPGLAWEEAQFNFGLNIYPNHGDVPPMGRARIRIRSSMNTTMLCTV